MSSHKTNAYEYKFACANIYIITNDNNSGKEFLIIWHLPFMEVSKVALKYLQFINVITACSHNKKFSVMFGVLGSRNLFCTSQELYHWFFVPLNLRVKRTLPKTYWN